jgi:hypothetical protein
MSRRQWLVRIDKVYIPGELDHRLDQPYMEQLLVDWYIARVVAEQLLLFRLFRRPKLRQ